MQEESLGSCAVLAPLHVQRAAAPLSHPVRAHSKHAEEPPPCVGSGVCSPAERVSRASPRAFLLTRETLISGEILSLPCFGT